MLMTTNDNIRDIEAAIQEEALHTARDWFKKCCYSGVTQWYLFYKPNRIQFCVAQIHPGNGWQLAAGERLSPAMTVQQAKWWISDIARKLPLLEVVEEEVA